MLAQCNIVLGKPIEPVFWFLADPRNRPRWQSSLRAVEMLSDGEPRVGMRWRERPGGLVRFDMRIIALDPLRHWAEAFTGAGVTGEIALSFAADGGATKISVQVALDLPRPLELAVPVFRPLLITTVRRDLTQLERLL